MAIRINTNVPSLKAQRNLANTSNMLESSMEKLSSGRRVNKASDDAAGLAISENLRAEIKGLKQAARNAEDGISLVQIAEGALNEVSNIAVRLRELAVQSASDTIGDSERKYLEVEYSQLLDEVNRVANSTEFNGVNLLNGTGKIFHIQVGTNNDPMVDRLTFDASKADIRPEVLGMSETGVISKEKALDSLAAIDDTIEKVSGIRADFGAIQNRLKSTINNIAIGIENFSSANSRVRDTDIAKESAELAKYNILTSAGTSILAQANTKTKYALDLVRSSLVS